MKRWIVQGVKVALESIDEVLELSLCRLRSAVKEGLQISIYIFLSELLRQLADVDDSLVKGVTVISDRPLSIVRNAQLALK